MVKHKTNIALLVIVLLLVSILIRSEGLGLLSVASAAPDTVGCVKGKNGIKQNGNGCSTNVTLKLKSGGVITSATSTGLTATTTAQFEGAGLHGIGTSSAGTFFSGNVGVLGDSSADVGVGGTTNTGHGIYGIAMPPGSGGVGVYAQNNTQNGYGLIAEDFGNSFALATHGDATQSRMNNGFVKAMAYFSGSATSPGRCFNSQQTGSLIHGSGCGISRSGSAGNYVVDFGFQINDRLISVTPESDADGIVSPTLSFASLANDQVRVKTFTVSGGVSAFVDRAFFVFVY